MKKSLLLLSAAALLLLGSTIGSTRAALTYYSDNYNTQVSLANIGVAIIENDKQVDDGKLLEGVTVVPGKEHTEALKVKNSGSIDTYVRVVLKKYWKDAEGKKATELSPDMIQLPLPEDSGWVADEAASTQERTVLYYTQPLAAGSDTEAFAETLKLDNRIAGAVTKTDTGNGSFTITYDYDGYTFHIEAEADAVQARNGKDAIKSAWGVDVEIDADGTLSLAGN
jgi:hypothetical protein